MKSCLAPLLICLALPCAAQVATPAAEPVAHDPAAAHDPAGAHQAATVAPDPATAVRPRAGEPEVKHTVINGETTRIDELRVRGVTQRITVTTKGPDGTSYEIITGDGSRDLSDGANTSRGAAGKRVWRILNF